MYRNYPFLVGGFALLFFLGACNTATPTEFKTEILPTSTVPLPLTETAISPTSTAFIPTVPPSPTESIPESPTPARPMGAGIDLCRVTNQDAIVDTTPTPAAGISVELDRSIPPAPPSQVDVDTNQAGVILSWQGTGTDVDQFYRIYRKAEGEDCWDLVGVQPVINDNRGVYRFIIPETDQLVNPSFAVATVDIYGQESNLSALVQVGAGE